MNFKVWFLAFGFSLFALSASSAKAIPTAEDINSLAEKARQTTDTFMQRSFQLRMAYEYSGKFLTRRDKENLHTLAKTAGDQLQAIAESQRKIKQQIEDYQGNDWDDRYGSTGLWRKLSTDIYITNLAKCEFDYYLALTVEQSPLNKTLQDVRGQIISLDTAHSSANSQLLRAKILALAQIDSAWQTLAIDILNSLMARSSVPDAIYFRAAIERIKLFSVGKLEALNSLAHKLSQSSCNNDFELILSLAFLQRQYDPQGFEKTVQIWPQIEDFLGSLVLSDLSHRVKQQQSLQQVSVFEAELAAQAAWENETKDYETLLGHLSGAEKFQTPLILYVAAIAFADSSPAKAVNLLIKASTLQSPIGGQKSDRLDIEAHEIARQAAQLAYSFYSQNPANCRFAIEAFENYRTMAAEKIDEKLEYLYTIILGDCGQAEKSKLLLDKIAGRPAGRWCNRAKLDLITEAIQQSQSKNQEKRSELLKLLGDLITDCRRNEENRQLRTEAINVYCRLLLEPKDKASTQKVLDVLTDAEIAIDPNLNVLKSNALRQLGRLEESANCLLAAIEQNRYEHAGEAMELLSEIINEIDQLQQQANDFTKLVSNCERIAKYCERISLSTFGLVPVSQARLYLAEISVFAAANEPEKLSQVDKLLNNLANDAANEVDVLRCRARLLTAQGKFAEAARLWAQAAKIRKDDAHEAKQRTWKWWRAKFYELDCCAKMPQTEKKTILHTIEVLESSFTDIPPLWAEKLNQLKQQCR